MKAVLQEQHGSAEVLSIGETDRPVPGDDQVVIKVAATTVNRADIIQREGNYNQPPGDSPILGLEVQGLSTSWVLEYQASRSASE